MNDSYRAEMQVIKMWAMYPKTLEPLLTRPNLTEADIKDILKEESLDYRYLLEYIEGIKKVILSVKDMKDWEE